MNSGRFAFVAEHPNPLSHLEVFDLYVPLIQKCGLGSVVEYHLVRSDIGDHVSGSASDLRARLANDPQSFSIETDKGFHLGLTLGGATQRWSAWHSGIKLDSAMLAGMITLCETLFRLEDPPTGISLARDERDLAFVPKPPIARHRHVITTTQADVEAAYDDPAVFWRQWTTVHEAGERRLCVRAATDNDRFDFVAETIDGTMAMARAAKPGLTEYGLPLKYPEELRRFWEYGPSAEEKAGFPALTFVGHDPATDVYRYTGFLERAPEERAHVRPRELCEIKRLGYSAEGDRVPGRVHVVFLDEWMARQERRPLRDVGARVFFYRPDGTLAEVID